MLIEEILGKVLDYKDNKLLIYTNFMFEGLEILTDDYYGNIYKITNIENKIITAL